MILSGLVQATRQMPQDMSSTEMGIVIAVCVLAGALLGYGIYATFHSCTPRKGGNGWGNGGGFDPTGYDPKPTFGVPVQFDDDEIVVVPAEWLEDKQDA